MVLNRRRPGYTRNDRAGRNAHRFLCRFYTSVARRERAEWQMRSGSGNCNKNPNHHQLALSSEYPTRQGPYETQTLAILPRSLTDPLTVGPRATGVRRAEQKKKGAFRGGLSALYGKEMAKKHSRPHATGA
jgi:hypothetical protein